MHFSVFDIGPLYYVIFSTLCICVCPLQQIIYLLIASADLAPRSSSFCFDATCSLPYKVLYLFDVITYKSNIQVVA